MSLAHALALVAPLVVWGGGGPALATTMRAVMYARWGGLGTHPTAQNLVYIIKNTYYSTYTQM